MYVPGAFVPESDPIFAGLKVVDLASYITGPAATTILSDFGATVVKVEPPNSGDPYRRFLCNASQPSVRLQVRVAADQ